MIRRNHGRAAAAIVAFFFFLFSGFIRAWASDASSALSKDQESAMVNLAGNLSSISPSSPWNAASGKSPCSWPGVRCTGGSVIFLSLSGFHLSDAAAAANFSVFPLICTLRLLETLDLSLNSLSSFPAVFLNSSSCPMISALNSLNLSSNVLAGRLPDLSAAGAAAMQTVDLSYNRLHGSIDSQFDGLPSLKVLKLASNNISGSIPTNLNAGVEVVVLSQNMIAGQIPAAVFSRYTALTHLDLGQNELIGTVPDGIEGLSKLQTLLLSSNNLTGEIPASISSIRTLSRFAANQNSFTGTIPAGFTNHLSSLDLSYNALAGEIPAGLLSPPNLQSVDLTFNLLRGQIPGNWSRSLYRLMLGHNQLAGSIPPEIGGLAGLTYLELDVNDLSGTIPEQLDQCKNLTLLNLASNKLQGGLPPELGDLTNLVMLQLQENLLNGEIPDRIFGLANLSTLDLSSNAFTGGISPAISGLQKVSMLLLNDNRLNGSIPSSIASLKSLIQLQLGSNVLSGTIPSLPNIGMSLNLSRNFFSGPIPWSFASLDQLEILDLSNNEFSGNIPVFLTQMHSLTELNLADNQLSGTFPTFPRWVSVNATGNPDLLPPNTLPSSPSSKRSSHAPIVAVAIVGSIVGFCLLVAFVFFVVSRRLYRIEDGGIEHGDGGALQIIRGTFITSNSIHQSGIDFNKAMEAVSNPGNVLLKTRFSTYYKAIMPNGASYAVKKLNWGDRAFQSSSHEKFGRELEDLGRLSNSNVMVPLAYVLTGESAYLFYESLHKGTVFDFLHNASGGGGGLDWPSRYGIALGVAQGLTFLHGCTQPVLLLDLTTKSIHLKSPKEPLIGDIELCKVVDPSKSTGSLSTVAGSVGYIPPEYAYTMRLTTAGNVYSFGVVLLELLTGKPPVDDGVELAKWAQSFSARHGGGMDILDPAIRRSADICSQMLSVLKVALSCVGASPESRPKMRNVLRMLFNAK